MTIIVLEHGGIVDFNSNPASNSEAGTPPVQVNRRTLVLELARSEFILRSEKVIALADGSTGTTHVALALGRRGASVVCARQLGP